MGDAMIGFLDQASRFLAPVYVGDTLYPVLEIAELKPGNTTGTMRVALQIYNQDGVLVCDGHQTYLLKKRPQ
jgi:acyl dehydratase